MKYLAYGEVLEGSGWILRDDLQSIKDEWYFSVRVFEVPDNFDHEAFKQKDKPRLEGIRKRYDLVFSDGALIHEEEWV